MVKKQGVRKKQRCVTPDDDEVFLSFVILDGDGDKRMKPD